MLPAELANEYAAARSRAIAEAETRKREAFSRFPRLAEIADERLEAAFALGVALRSAEDKEALRRETREKLAALSLEQARILADNGLRPDHLEPRFKCAECSDTGFLPGGELCRCARKRLMRLKYASSGLSDGARFELFSTSIYSDAEQRKRSVKAKQLCELYAGELRINGAPGLLIMGEAGLGKTFLMDCIGRRALERGRSVQKYTAYNMTDMMLKTVRERTSAPNFSAPELLLLDDLGTEPMIPNITIEALFVVINERQNAARPTVIATNLDRRRILDQYGERLFSRLFDVRNFACIELAGRDLRL